MLTQTATLKILIAIAILLIIFIVYVIARIRKDQKELFYMYHPKPNRINPEADDELEQEFWGTLKQAEIFS